MLSTLIERRKSIILPQQPGLLKSEKYNIQPVVGLKHRAKIKSML